MIQYEYEPEELRTIDQPPEYLIPYGELLSREKNRVDVLFRDPKKAVTTKRQTKKDVIKTIKKEYGETSLPVPEPKDIR